MHTDGVTVFSQWPLQHFFDYIFSFDSIVSNLQYPRECQGELWIIVRGDGLPCGGESWCQMSISFANHGHLARTLSHHWTVNVALCGEKSTSVLSQVWANNLAFLQSALDSGVVPIRGASRRCRIFCGGVNERLFLYFEVPRWNGNSRSNLCNAQKLADEVRAYFADEELW